MDKNIITRELQILLEAINEQFEIIREYENVIPQIEFDMIMENVRKLYETFHRLQRLNDPLLFVEKKIAGSRDLFKAAPQPKPLVNPVKADEPEPFRLQESQPVIPPAAVSPAPQASQPVIPPAAVPPAPQASQPVIPPAAVSPAPQASQQSIPPATVAPAKPAPKKETPAKPKPATGELELFATEEPVFSIKLKEAREKAFGPKITGQESFKASIGINDKFMFINELFDGNLREYNESIEALGSFKTLPQAQEHLDMLRKKYNWSSSLPAFTRIKEKVESRF